MSLNNTIFSITLCSIILSDFLLNILGDNTMKILPLKIDIEIKRTYNFLKLAIFVKNESSEVQIAKFKLIVSKRGESANLSKITQVKDLFLLPQEIALPFITEVAVDPKEFMEITLQVFDERGELVFEKSYESGELVE